VLCADTAIQGAGLNVLINLSGISDPHFVETMRNKVLHLRKESEAHKQSILAIVEGKI
jgi:formiminotetrahydrofolate cyclodeaminase